MVSVISANVDKCLEAQVEEIEVLCSIYEDEMKTVNEVDRTYSIEIKQGSLSVILNVSLPPTYPYESPPTYILQAPTLSTEQKNELGAKLNEVYLQNIGQTVLYQWIDKIKEYLYFLVSNLNTVDNLPSIVVSKCKYHEENNPPDIIHGNTIVDRKSVFQGHAAFVLSLDEVLQVLSKLKENRKIANATHNIYAFRITQPNNCLIQDSNDDGEVHAGRRLLHLLQILKVTNILVIVSRWYGGIHLGTQRFRHINNAARQVLLQAGIITEDKNKIKS